VLDDLVDQNVINQSQSDQIAAALTARAIEVREEMRQWHEENPGHGRFGRGFRQGFHLGALLDDGVIDEEELASLPDDHPLKDPDGPAADYLSGGLTLEELNQIREQHRAERWGTDT
jgi:hypothetical protein